MDDFSPIPTGRPEMLRYYAESVGPFTHPFKGIAVVRVGLPTTFPHCSFGGNVA